MEILRKICPEKISKPLLLVTINFSEALICPSEFPEMLTLYVPTPQNGQTHSNYSSAALADELFECGWHFKGTLMQI